MELRSFGAATRPRDRDRVFPCAALGAAVILFACNAFFVGAARARAPWSAALPALATSPAPTPLTNAELVPTVPARSFVPTSEHNASSTLPPIPQPSVAPSRAPSTLAPSTAARANSSRTNPLEIEALLNATIGGVVNCAVRHGLCDVSSCTRNDDGVTASCGCTERPASSTATIALGWPSAVLAEHDEYLAALRDDDDDGDDSFHGLCAALENGTIWPNAAFTSLWSPNPYFHDDALLSTQVACGEVWGANCMGAPCYRVAYNSTPAVFNITCVCPVKFFDSLDVHDVSSDTCGEARANSSCATVTGTWWREEHYEKLTETISQVAKSTPQPKPELCKNDCEYCCADCDYTLAPATSPTPKGTPWPVDDLR